MLSHKGSIQTPTTENSRYGYGFSAGFYPHGCPKCKGDQKGYYDGDRKGRWCYQCSHIVWDVEMEPEPMKPRADLNNKGKGHRKKGV